MTPPEEAKPVWHPEYGLGNDERLHAVEMRLKGYTTREVAEVFGVKTGTVWLWMKQWRQAQEIRSRNPER